MTGEDRRLLGLTFDLARAGLGATSPNPAVGALLVRGGAIVGRGFHARAGEEHAETLALREAGGGARGADLYVNLEPCCSHRILEGRTSPCVDQLIAAGVRRVVAAAKDPNPRMNGRGLSLLEAAGVLVEREDPVFARYAARFNEIFFRFISTGRPFVALKAGLTLDGRIAIPSGESKWITDEAARREARGLRRRYDAVLIGIRTVLADDPGLLPDAEGEVSDPRLARVILDSRLRIPLDSRLVEHARVAPLLVYAAEEGPAAARSALEARGAIVVQAGKGRVPIPWLLEDLAGRGITSVLVEGGGETLGAFLRGGHADKVYLFLAPRLMGGRMSIPAFGGPAPATIAGLTGLTDLQIRRAGGALLLEGYPVRPHPGAGGGD